MIINSFIVQQIFNVIIFSFLFRKQLPELKMFVNSFANVLTGQRSNLAINERMIFTITGSRNGFTALFLNDMRNN